MKTTRISAKIASLLAFISIASIFFLYRIMNGKITRILEDKTAEDMSVIARDRAELIETYIEGCCDFLAGYSKSAEIVDVLENPSEQNIKRAREYTNKCAAEKEYMEGLYVARWDTYVLAHINPDSVDKTFRDAKGAGNLEAQIRQRKKAFCSGIVQAPVTKKMVIPVYSPVFNKAGEPIGFAGAAFYTDELSEKLSKLKTPTRPTAYTF